MRNWVKRLLFSIFPGLVIQAQIDTISMVEQVVVNATRIPMQYQEIGRSLAIIDQQTIQQIPAQTLDEVLNYVAGVDVRTRGPLGVQSDISIRGGHYEQTLILVNGLRINNPQTGHNSLAIALPLHLIDHIEVINGGSTRVLGPDAIAGSINIITKKEVPTQVVLDIMGGQHGLHKIGLTTSFQNSWSSTSVVLEKAASEGYTEDTFFDKSSLYFQTDINPLPWVDLQFSAAHFENDFGAGNFYAASFPSQYEEVHTGQVQAAMHSSLAKNWELYAKSAFYRGADLFDLDNYRKDQSTYDKLNYHLTSTYHSDIEVKHTNSLGTFLVGTSYRKEQIYSNRLGYLLSNETYIPQKDNLLLTHYDSRDYITLQAEYKKKLHKFTLSAGVLQTFDQLYGNSFFPGVDLTYQWDESLSMFASTNYASRRPTFTELYLNNPSLQGNENLAQEFAWTYELGMRWSREGQRFIATGFVRDTEQAIDKVQAPSDPKPKMINIPAVIFYGAEFEYQADLRTWFDNYTLPLTSINLSYMWVDSNKNTDGAQSFYALDYLKHNIMLDASFNFFGNYYLNTQFSLQKRNNLYYDPVSKLPQSYAWLPLLQGRLSWKKKPYHIYIEGDNLLDEEYSDFGYVTMSGLWLRGGIIFQLVAQ